MINDRSSWFRFIYIFHTRERAQGISFERQKIQTLAIILQQCIVLVLEQQQQTQQPRQTAVADDKSNPHQFAVCSQMRLLSSYAYRSAV